MWSSAAVASTVRSPRRIVVLSHKLYPVSTDQLEFVWKLIGILYPPFDQSFVVIFQQFCFSIDVQGG